MAGEQAAPQAVKAPDFGKARGVVHGSDFTFSPPPNSSEFLGKPLIVDDLPAHRLPQRGWKERLVRRLAEMNIGHNAADIRARWAVQEAVARLIIAVASPHSNGARLARTLLKGQRIIASGIRHPYHLLFAIEMAPRVAPSCADERRTIEAILIRAAKKYAEQSASSAEDRRFSYERRSTEYFRAAFRAEHMLSKIVDADERHAALQSIYNNYYHGIANYILALYSRERLDESSPLFMYYIRGSLFKARLSWDGQLMDKPARKMLPTREEVAFYLRRDRAVQSRMKTDQEYALQVKDILKAFPGA